MEHLHSNWCFEWRREQAASHKRKLRVEVEAQTDSGDPEKQCERFAQKPSRLKRNCSVEHG